MGPQAMHVEDVGLVDRCLGGEEAAARELFRRHARRVHGTLYRVLGSNADMDDLLQETFLQVFQSLRGFRGEARLTTWIDRIAARVAYHYLARRRPPTVQLELVDDPPGRDAPGAEHALAREGVRRLYAALAAVPASARIAYTLHEIDGREVAEVATMVGASRTATKVRIWRARRALRRVAAADPVLAEFLGRDDDGPDDDKEDA